MVITPGYLLVTHGERMLDSLPLVHGNYDFGRITEILVRHKKELNLENELVVAVARPDTG